VSFATWKNGKNGSKQKNERSTLNEETLYNRSGLPTLDKRKCINVYERQKRRRVSSQGSYDVPTDHPCLSPAQSDHTNIHLRQKDEKGFPVIGVRQQASCMVTKARIAPSPINDATDSNQGDVSSQTTTEDTIRSSTPLKPVPITGIIRTSSSLASMPRRNRLNTNGNGPDVFGWNSPVQRMVHWSDEIGVADSVTETETGWHEGCGAPSKDSRPDLSSRTGSRPWTGGDDTILTPFSLSPMTDTAVDSLPALFLAYCTLVDSDDVMSDDDRVVPRGSDSDPVPLLTGCALSLSPLFLSRSRR
jgi:hypothetical protein